MKIKKYSHKEAMNQLPNWLTIQAIIPAIASALVYGLLTYVINVIIRHQPNYSLVEAIGMFILMSLLMELIAYFYSKIAYQKLSKLIDAIDKVAYGDFNVTLEEGKSGPFKNVNENFNKMITELRSVQIFRNDFINDFSHEFKTPITSINGFAKLLLDTEVSEEERKQYLQIIADESDRLALLAKETLMMSQLDNQQSIPDKELYSLDKQIKQNIILLSHEWSEKEIELLADLELVTYYGNMDLMTQVWINLLSNSIKFTQRNGKIKINLKQRKDMIVVSVSDTGKGMTKEQLDKIFNKYYQGDVSHASKGLGLGLSIAHRIVELCNGRIEVTSKVDEGSTFTVYLPCEI